MAGTLFHIIIATFWPQSQLSYRLFSITIYAIMLSYGIVIFKTNSFNHILKTTFRNPLLFFSNTNNLYLSVSFLYLTNYDIFQYIQGPLYPFALYSLFHGISYTKTHVLNTFLGPSSVKQGIDAWLTQVHKNYYESSLYLTANLEITLMFQLLFQGLKSLLFVMSTPPTYLIRVLVINFLYFGFLKLRYQESVYVRNVIQGYDLRINQMLYNGKFPQFAVGLWWRLRSLIVAN